MNKQDAVFLAARGGAGGHGNEFYLSNEVRAPMTAEAGALGEELGEGLERGTVTVNTVKIRV